MFQKTINKSITIDGIGIHSGQAVKVVLHPDFANTGISMRKVTGDNAQAYVKASPELVKSTFLATIIGLPSGDVSTVEHLMSALVGLGIDNVKIDFHNDECPIMDGSALPFVEKILEAGINQLAHPKKFLKIVKPFNIVDGDKYIEVIPSRFFKVTTEIEYPHPMIRRSKASVNVQPESYMETVCQARTFGFKSDADKLLSMGLSKGASLQNTVVFDDSGLLNEEGLRSEDEPVMHKLLDIIGDVALIGMPIMGHIRAYKSGHSINNMLARRIATDSSVAELIDVNIIPDANEEIVLPVFQNFSLGNAS